jgi:hypothetical protein
MRCAMIRDRLQRAGRGPRRWLVLAVLGLALDAVAVAMMTGQDWLIAFSGFQTVRWLRLRAFQGAFAVYVATAGAVPIVLIASIASGLRARKAGNRRLAARAGRAFLLGLESIP